MRQSDFTIDKINFTYDKYNLSFDKLFFIYVKSNLTFDNTYFICGKLTWKRYSMIGVHEMDLHHLTTHHG